MKKESQKFSFDHYIGSTGSWPELILKKKVAQNHFAIRHLDPGTAQCALAAAARKAGCVCVPMGPAGAKRTLRIAYMEHWCQFAFYRNKAKRKLKLDLDMINTFSVFKSN